MIFSNTCFGILGCCLFTSLATAADFKGRRSLSFDSAYVPALSSNRAFWQFGLEFEGVGGLAFDTLDHWGLGSSVLTRSLLAGATYFLWPRVDGAFRVANHELGHGARMTSLGGTPSYVWTSRGIPHGNIFSFFIEGLFKGPSAATASGSGSRRTTAPNSFGASVISGGMNNSAMFAEALEEQVLLGDGHVLEYMAYVSSKLDAANYVRNSQSGTTGNATSSDDIENILSIYSGRGFRISGSDIRTGSLVSRWLSSTHWAYGLAAFRYVMSGDPSVPPPVIGSFKAPDISHFLMYDGLSIKIRSAIVGATDHYPVELEYVYKGNPILELSAGHRSLRKLGERTGMNAIQLFANTKGGLGAKGQLDASLGPRLIGSLGASLYTSNLLEGQRNIARFVSAQMGYEAWARVSLIF